ncbi:Ig-like domain-containing protein [Fibrobacter sp. UWB13]|uniref:Ig-like domain-containing protein n=1 Tax=Fibrobacter sp. UWB13 TaxID=1896204 RepID=UPI000A1C7C88|nr:Ig-like domain-containing protein [Fibrobacter sp. UWB13]
MGIKTNNGWGEVIAGTAAKDSDKDGMPDYFEEAMGYDINKDDAMTKESDGYVRIEKYINWLGASHMHITDESSRNFDLRTITSGFQSVKPTYSVSAAENGMVELLADGYTARFTPKENFKGMASFKYIVKGNDKTEYTGRVEVLVEKAESAVDSSAQDSSTTRIVEKFRLRGNSETVKIFDMNGNYMGTSTSNLPQGHYIVRQNIQGRVVNFLYNKN